MTATPSLLREAGELLFGDRWQAALAEALGVSDRTMRRWVSGENPIPDGAWADVLNLLRKRGKDVAAFLAKHGE